MPDRSVGTHVAFACFVVVTATEAHTLITTPEIISKRAI
jgi:hypothetical protein